MARQKVFNEDGSEKGPRIQILHDDYLRIYEIFNIRKDTQPSFRLLFHRLVECLEMLLEKDDSGVLEELSMKWAIDEADYQHWLAAKKGDQR